MEVPDLMKKKSPASFTDDALMRDLHRLRSQHHAKTKTLSPDAYAKQVEQEAAALLKQHGFAVIRRADGREVVERVPRKRKTA
jgi:hypothetical protein